MSKAPQSDSRGRKRRESRVYSSFSLAHQELPVSPSPEPVSVKFEPEPTSGMARSESSTPRGSQTPRIPISLEGERRKALKLIYAMERECVQFRNTWLVDVDDDYVEEWLEFVNLAKNRIPGAAQYKSYKEFSKDLIVLREDTGYLGSRDETMDQLKTVCDRAKAFDTVFEASHQRIDAAFNHYMKKYCLSFFGEIEDMDVECVRDYENSISLWQAEILQCLNDAEKAIQHVGGKNFAEYVRSYAQVVYAMTTAIDSFLSVTDPFRSWVTADEGYVKRIRLELTCLEGQKSRVAETIRKRSFKVHEQKAQELRTSFNNKKLGEKVQGAVYGRRYCRNREFSFVDKIEMTENVLAEKKMALEQAKCRVQSRPIHSLVREKTDGMTDRSSRLQREVKTLEKQLEQMKKGKRDMRETRYSLQRQYHDLKGEYDTSVKQAHRQSEHFKENIQHNRSLCNHQKLLDRKIRALKSIIYIKTNPNTVKKIYFDGYTNGEHIDFRGPSKEARYSPADTFREAMHVAAAGVGKDWNKMYHQLPFNPPRSMQNRHRDLEILDMDFRSVHPPTEQMALRSLDKWTSLSNETSVNALVRTLKSIKKTEVAKKIEKQVLTVVN